LANVVLVYWDVGELLNVVDIKANLSGNSELRSRLAYGRVEAIPTLRIVN
jgi:hypothetical protein